MQKRGLLIRTNGGILLCLLTIGIAVCSPAVLAAENSCVGPYTVGVQIDGDDGDPIAGKEVTVINKKTGDQVFSGTTDNAGQIDVTLPRGNYEVVAGSQSKQVNLRQDTDVALTLPTDELPKTR